MKIEELKNYNRLIVYDDDNHAMRVFVNGIFITDLGLGMNAALELVSAGQDCPIDKTFTTVDVYYPALCEDFGEEVATNVHDLLAITMKLTPEQEVNIINKNYAKI